MPLILTRFAIISIGILVILSFTLTTAHPKNNQAAETKSPYIFLEAPIVLATTSKFSEKIIEEGIHIPFTTQTELDPKLDACADPQIKQPGKPGRHTKEIRITYYENQEYQRETIATHREAPQPEVLVKGTQKNYQTIQTDSGPITYWCKRGNFTATAYDPTCKGCDSTTAIGLKAGFGVVAVDPSVIPLRSQLYITGYGKAIAGDTGGSIKGNRVDLGFDSIGAWWGRREVEVYLL